MFTKSKLFNSCLLVIMIAVTGFTLMRAPQVGAFSLPEFVESIKDLFKDKPKELTIESSIDLAPGGDLDGNEEISSGDIVRYSYTINNPTEEEYLFGTFNTNIDRKSLNFIHNVQGVSALSDNGETLVIPNFKITPFAENYQVSFDARINYFSDVDKELSTEAEFISQEQKKVVKSTKETVKALKLEAKDLEKVGKTP